MTDFFSSEAGEYASVAKAFLEGALTLDAARPSKDRILFRPTLALAGHGLELMLKACICLNGEQPPTKGRNGHDIVGLWQSDLCEPVRGHVYVNAKLAAEELRAGGDYLGVPDRDAVSPLVEEYVTELGKLHGGNGYPLRYPAHRDQMAPRTPFLVRSLWRTANDLVSRPNDFLSQRFRGME